MMSLKQPPGAGGNDLTEHYRRCASEGVVFSAPMRAQRFGFSASFDPAWGVASACWCVGGEEHYQFADGRRVTLKAGSVLVIGERERYAFAADTLHRYVSSMVVFPTAMTEALSPEHRSDEQQIDTRLLTPDAGLISSLTALTREAAGAEADATLSDLLEERATLILADLWRDQGRAHKSVARLPVSKASTRAEAARRIAGAVALLHEDYRNPDLDLAAMAEHACIARHRFVRVFRQIQGTTPARYLRRIRMAAAAQLLDAHDWPVAEIARCVGYSSRAAFQRRFAQHFGVPPQRWRQRH